MNCSVCHTSHRDTYAYKRHCNSAKHRANLEDPTKGVKCEHCGKKYKFIKSMKFHQKTCKEYLKSVSTQTNGNTDLSTLDKKPRWIFPTITPTPPKIRAAYHLQIRLELLHSIFM